MFTQQQGRLRYQLASLAISHFAPLITYFAIRPFVASDTDRLAIAWFIPVAWTIGSSLWLQRLDVFALLGVVTYGVALSIAIFFNAGSLPLKLHHAVLGGAVGLVCLFSSAMGKPIFVLFIRWLSKQTAQATQIEVALANPLVVQRISRLTLVIGIASLADAVIQTALAILLSTSAFLAVTTAIHVAAVVGIVLGVFFWVKFAR